MFVMIVYVGMLLKHKDQIMKQGYWVSVHRAQSEIRGKVDPASPNMWIYKLPLSDRPIEGRGHTRIEARTAFIERFTVIQKSNPEVVDKPSEFDPTRAKWVAEGLEFMDKSEFLPEEFIAA